MAGEGPHTKARSTKQQRVIPGPCYRGGSTHPLGGGAAAGAIRSGWTGVVVVVPGIAAASSRSAMTAPVPTSTMAAKTPAVTSSGRYHG